jgi:hypothetical protein
LRHTHKTLMEELGTAPKLMDGWARSGSLRCVAGDQPPAFPERRGPGRVAPAAGGRIRVLGPQALAAGGIAVPGAAAARRVAHHPSFVRAAGKDWAVFRPWG